MEERSPGNGVPAVGDGAGNRWWLVAAAGLAVFMAQLDTTIVNVALPAIEAELGTSTSVTQWVVLGYLVPAIVLALPGGRWLDRVPARWALTFSVVGFVAASILAGAAA
jgi:MFS family permease